MAELSEHALCVFQNLSVPWSAADDYIVPSLDRASSPGGVSSLTTAAASIGRSIGGSPSGSGSWLARKSSFKAAVRVIRSVSVTTMAAAVSRSPHHQRVASVKSAKASIMRKNSEAESMHKTYRQDSASSLRPGMNYSSTNSSLCTTTSQDVTSPSMPPLESQERAIFDLLRDREDTESRESQESSQYSDSLLESDDANSMPLIHKMDESPCKNQSSADDEDAYADESEWAKQALKMRIDKGRVDSTCTNEVTFINTYLNQTLHFTDEGDAIRRQIAADESPREEKTLKRMISDDNTMRPPILTIEPPSPMPTNNSPFCNKSYLESDTETVVSAANFVINSSALSEDTNLIDHEHADFCKEPIKSTLTPIRIEKNQHRRRRGRGAHSSHSFSSVRDRKIRRRIKSDSRSSSEPPAIVEPPLLARIDPAIVENNTFIPINIDEGSDTTESNSALLSESYHGSTDNNSTSSSAPGGANATSGAAPVLASNVPGSAKTSNIVISGSNSSRHASGESDGVAGCSPKGMTFLILF